MSGDRMAGEREDRDVSSSTTAFLSSSVSASSSESLYRRFLEAQRRFLPPPGDGVEGESEVFSFWLGAKLRRIFDALSQFSHESELSPYEICIESNSKVDGNVDFENEKARNRRENRNSKIKS